VSSRSAAVTFELAAAALTLGDIDLAGKLVHAFPGSSDADHPLATVESLLLAAWLSETDGFTEIARRQLREAMAIAERYSLVETFVRAGPTIVRLVSDLPDADSDFRRQILRRAQATGSSSLGSDLVEPLTVRELEILWYLPSRLTNTELADHFYVSVNTIKTHMVHIYRKLGVANRNGAVSRAHEIGVL
jgi:LuxR family maltose regulon positive regulatory protein